MCCCFMLICVYAYAYSYVAKMLRFNSDKMNILIDLKHNSHFQTFFHLNVMIEYLLIIYINY